MSASASLARAWLGTVGANALILVFGIGTGILAARLLGPSDRGLLAVIMFWPGLVAGIGFLSLGEAIVFRLNKTTIARHRFVATIAVLAIGMAILVNIIGMLALPLMLGADRVDALSLATLYFMAFVPFNFIALALLAVDHAECRFSRYNLLRLLPPGIYLLGLLLLWSISAISVEAALWSSWLGTALAASIRLWSWRKDLMAWPEWREMVALLRQALLFHGTSVVIMLGSQIDRLVVMRLFADMDIGHYVVALTIATAGLGLVTSSVHTVLFPRLAAEPIREKALTQLRAGLRRSTLFLITGSVLAISLIPIFLPFLFGEEFIAAVPVAVLLILAYVPLALRQIVIRCLRAFGDARTGIFAEGAALVVFLLLVPAIYLLGLIAVPAALTIANLAGLVVVSIQLRERHGISTKDWLLPSRAMVSDAAILAGRLHRFALVSR